MRVSQTVLLPAAYLNYYLTGDYVADMSDSAGTSWLDVGARGTGQITYWMWVTCGAIKCPVWSKGQNLQDICATTCATLWGINGPVTIAGGAGDNAAAARGIGALNEGVGFVSWVLLASYWRPATGTDLHLKPHCIRFATLYRDAGIKWA